MYENRSNFQPSLPGLGTLYGASDQQPVGVYFCLFLCRLICVVEIERAFFKKKKNEEIKHYDQRKHLQFEKCFFKGPRPWLHPFGFTFPQKALMKECALK